MLPAKLSNNVGSFLSLFVLIRSILYRIKDGVNNYLFLKYVLNCPSGSSVFVTYARVYCHGYSSTVHCRSLAIAFSKSSPAIPMLCMTWATSGLSSTLLYFCGQAWRCFLFNSVCLTCSVTTLHSSFSFFLRFPEELGFSCVLSSFSFHTYWFAYIPKLGTTLRYIIFLLFQIRMRSYLERKLT